jgi:CRISPR-associated protein Csb1
MTSPLTLATLRAAVAGGAVAIRRIQRLQPAGGAGDKVFPPTYEGGQYATEERVIDGRRVPCVLLDSVQSQANRMELALKQACYHGKGQEADIPVVTVDFDAAGLAEVGEITSLDAPHRLADAILRDSLNGTVKFRDSTEGKVLDTASLANATGLYGICPTALVFGLWDSTGPRGGLGTKFQRALVGEIVGVDSQGGVKPSSRLDPLGIQLNAGPVYEAKQGGWTTDPSLAKTDKGKPVLIGKEGKPSEINHGNVTPSLKNDKGQPHHGGATLAYAQQSVVLSLPALRRLRFPGDDSSTSERDTAARTALAALAIAATDMSIAQGCDLRSRCLLVPDPDHPATWEIIGTDGRPQAVTVADAKALLIEAAATAAAAGLPAWKREPLVLKPSDGLATLVKKSHELAAAAPAEG